jgi:(p)ppGpp synthase/HD superfamily hydrolase
MRLNIMRPPPTVHDILSPLIEQAIELAAQWHDGTYRKNRWRDPAFTRTGGDEPNVPVVSHVATVAHLVQRAGWDDVTVAAAYLHDVAEDRNRSGERLTVEQLRALMGSEVTDRVLEVTENQLDESGRRRKWRERKEMYVARLESVSAEAMAISLADKLHNLWSINQGLALGMDVFTSDEHRKALTAGPTEQRWFHRAVLDASGAHEDPRLVVLRRRLEDEVVRFEDLTGTNPNRAIRTRDVRDQS